MNMDRQDKGEVDTGFDIKDVKKMLDSKKSVKREKMTVEVDLRDIADFKKVIRARKEEVKQIRLLRFCFICLALVQVLLTLFFIFESVIVAKADEIENVQMETIQEFSTDKTNTLTDVGDLPSEIEKQMYTDEQLYILSHIICGEARGYSDELQLAVGSVFLNRVKDPRFPDTFEGVAFQKKQYACTRDGNYYREPTESNIKNAIYLLENGPQLPSNVIFQAEFKQGKGVYKTIKLKGKRKMYFCY